MLQIAFKCEFDVRVNSLTSFIYIYLEWYLQISGISNMQNPIVLCKTESSFVATFFIFKSRRREVDSGLLLSAMRYAIRRARRETYWNILKKKLGN